MVGRYPFHILGQVGVIGKIDKGYFERQDLVHENGQGIHVSAVSVLEFLGHFRSLVHWISDIARQVVEFVHVVTIRRNALGQAKAIDLDDATIFNANVFRF